MSAPASVVGSESLVARLLRGDSYALSRAITAVENNTPGARAVLRAIQPQLGNALVIGFTGAPGAGKSTLCSAFIAELRRRELTIGLIAVDPSSPLSGGAILGDRIRMAEHDTDPQVFVRSLASRGHLGGLAPAASHVIDVMDAAGKDVVIIETVGAGQSEVEIATFADTKIVVCAPGLGDDIQAMKAGILEIADVLVVNKADSPLADRTFTQLTNMLALRDHDTRPEVPVIKTVATQKTGITELADAALAHAASARARDGRGNSLQRVRLQLASRAARLLEHTLARSTSAEIDLLCVALQRGDLDFDAAAATVLARIFDR